MQMCRGGGIDLCQVQILLAPCAIATVCNTSRTIPIWSYVSSMLLLRTSFISFCEVVRSTLLEFRDTSSAVNEASVRATKMDFNSMALAPSSLVLYTFARLLMASSRTLPLREYHRSEGASLTTVALIALAYRVHE